MTTLAYDGIHLAADGLVTTCGARQWLNERKIRVENGAIYAMAGSTCMFDPLIKWCKAGADASKVPAAFDAEWGLLVITRDGAYHYSHHAPYAERIPDQFTNGTGHQYALGAMKAGASAEEAVRIACEIDIHSGGEIQVVNIKEALGMAPRLVEAG